MLGKETWIGRRTASTGGNPHGARPLKEAELTVADAHGGAAELAFGIAHLINLKMERQADPDAPTVAADHRSSILPTPNASHAGLM